MDDNDDHSGSRIDDGIDQDAALQERNDQPSEVGRVVPAWLISFAAHATIGLAFSMVVFSQQSQDQELPPQQLTVINPPPEKPRDEQRPERTLVEKQQVTIDPLTPSDVAAPLTPVSVDVVLEPSEVQDEAPRGREEAISVSEMGNTGIFMAIGVGGGGSGLKGSRIGNGKRTSLVTGGGTISSENAVDAALRWFKKHQSPNGMWDTVNYYQNCGDEGRCEKGASHDQSDANIAASGYALLCYLGAGYDHITPNRYQTTVRTGVRWLKDQQQANGLFGNRNYEHAIATLALAEAYAMTQDGELRAPAQRAVDYLLLKQNRDSKGSGRLGWDYSDPTGRNDSSVTGWCVMALKGAVAANLEVKDGLVGAQAWLKQTYELSNPQHGTIDPYAGTAEFVYAWKGGDLQGDKDRVSMGALCAAFLPRTADDRILQTLLNYATRHQLPTGYPCNTYYLYYNTLAAYQGGGERWQKWNGSVRDMLVGAQRRDACFDGSWDFTGTGFHGHHIGRMLSTAYCCLSLEVYYRYKQVGGVH